MEARLDYNLTGRIANSFSRLSTSHRYHENAADEIDAKTLQEISVLASEVVCG